MSDAGPFAYSVAQLANAWGVSQRHVYDLCATGKLGHLRIGTLIRVRQTDREAYEAEQWQAPRPALPPTYAGTVPSRGAFQRGRQTARAERDATLAKSGAVR
jgi:excisionase family DNA binding protein